MPEVEKIFDWRGIRGLCAAPVVTDTAEKYECGEVFPVAGMSKLTKSTDASIATKYYDNKPAIINRNNGVDEVSVDASGIEDSVQAKLVGEDYDESTGMYVEGEPEAVLMAMGYITKDTNGVEYGVWRLKGVFNYPETEHNTEDNGNESTGSTMTYTGLNTDHKFTYKGKSAKAVRVPLDKFPGGEEAFFATVQTPDTVKAAAAAAVVTD